MTEGIVPSQGFTVDAFIAATPVTRKFISNFGSESRWTGAGDHLAFLACCTNYLTDPKHADIVDIAATTALRQAQATARRVMLDRILSRLDLAHDNTCYCHICFAGKQLSQFRRKHATPRSDIHSDGFVRYRVAKRDCDVCTLKLQRRAGEPAYVISTYERQRVWLLFLV